MSQMSLFFVFYFLSQNFSTFPVLTQRSSTPCRHALLKIWEFHPIVLTPYLDCEDRLNKNFSHLIIISSHLGMAQISNHRLVFGLLVVLSTKHTVVCFSSWGRKVYILQYEAILKKINMVMQQLALFPHCK